MNGVTEINHIMLLYDGSFIVTGRSSSYDGRYYMFAANFDLNLSRRWVKKFKDYY